MMQLQIVLMLIAILKEMDDTDMELQILYIQSLAQQMVLCDMIGTMIQIAHIERPLIPAGCFNCNNLPASYKFLFRVEMEEFDDLYHGLRMPLTFRTSQRYSFRSHDALHIVLRRFAFPCRWDDLVPLFHRSGSALSCISHHTVQWIIDTYKHLLVFNPACFAHLLPEWVCRSLHIHPPYHLLLLCI
jgi:hypothetical protein